MAQMPWNVPHYIIFKSSFENTADFDFVLFDVIIAVYTPKIE